MIWSMRRGEVERFIRGIGVMVKSCEVEEIVITHIHYPVILFW